MKRKIYETKMYVSIPSKIDPRTTTEKIIPVTLDLKEIFMVRPGLEDSGVMKGCIVTLNKGNLYLVDDYEEMRNYVKKIWDVEDEGVST